MERIPSEVVNTPKPRGREAIPTFAALSTQITLMHRMSPERLQPYIGTSDGQSVGIEDALFRRWSDKYAHHFQEYCDDHADDVEFFERIKDQALTPTDVKAIQLYVEDVDRGGPFFNANELEDFIRENVH